ncbi:MAG: hypothetical protein NWF06_05445 [Candidatus Bathyarchaeota archaeon]|nr:hypothetical protein [Candidatus Bathyarchaeum sp.]
MLPLSLSDISLWLAVMALILLATSKVIIPYSTSFGYFAIDKQKMQLVALLLGASFVATVLIGLIMPYN